MKRDDGAVSLAAALIVPVLLVFLTHVFSFAVQAKTDWDLARLAAAVAEAELASYNRSLYDSFGLFAASMDGTSSAEATDTLVSFSPESLLINGKGALSNPDVLKRDILRHMKVRAPLSLLSDVLNRHANNWSMFSQAGNSLESQIQALTSAYDLGSPYDRIKNSIDMPEGDQRSILEELIDKEITSLYEDIVTDIMPADIYEPGQAMPADLFNPDHLSNLGAAVDRLFRIQEYGVFDRLYLSEYVLSYFHHTTPVLYAGLHRIELKTPDGRLLASLPESRRYEVEQILFDGTQSEAKQHTSDAIRAIRTVILLANNYSDTSKHAGYRAKASIVSGAILLASVGTVSIPPESLTFLFMLYDAVSDAKKDVGKLLRGRPVRVWPRAGLELYYPDYLRMLLLSQPIERLTNRIYMRISTIYAGPHYTSLDVYVSANGRHVSQSGGYRSSSYHED